MWGIDIDARSQGDHVSWWSSRELSDIKRRNFCYMVLDMGGIPRRCDPQAVKTLADMAEEVASCCDGVATPLR